MSPKEFEKLIVPNCLLIETIFLDELLHPVSLVNEGCDILIYGLQREESNRDILGFYSYYIRCTNDMQNDYSERVYRASNLSEVSEVVNELKKVHSRLIKRLKVA